MFKKRKKSIVVPLARKLITSTSPKSIISEQFRTIRTNIEFSSPDQTIKTILVTSSVPGEGKTTTAANLAVVFAQEGKKVLIVDSDMRKPALHYTFDILNEKGLSNVLTRHQNHFLALYNTKIENLFIIPSGPIPPNPSELLSTQKFEIFLEEVKELYDLIIFDAPPLLSVTDAQILSHKCDGTILVVKSGFVDKVDVLKAKTSLNTVHAKILGVVLNNYNTTNSNYYEYY
ncbi:tyrosine protein kinase [Lysinibacillus sp. PLM2]|nr:tyrosine protein kinase [Lysinibacillus sp. PLM2]